jgi:hypothetical protein
MQKYYKLKTLLLAIIITSLPVVATVIVRQQEMRQSAAGTIAIGANVRGIINYGKGDLLPSSQTQDIDASLSEIKRMGGTIVRVFVGNNKISDSEAANRLSKFLDKAATYNISVIVSLIDFYESGYAPAGIAYTRTDFTPHLLGDDFFNGGYQGRYKSFVQTVINSNKNHSNIYAWEPGNELKDDSNPASFINFLKDITAYIKGLDSSHPVSTGMIGSWHTGLTPDQLYPNLPNVDIITIHAYYDDSSYSKGSADASWAKSHGKRFIIEEGLKTGTNDRLAIYTNELNYWIAQGAQAYLQWGFIGKSVGDNGDGDSNLGMDYIWHSADYDKLVTLFQQLSGNGGIAIPTNIPITGSPKIPLPIGTCQTVNGGNYAVYSDPDSAHANVSPIHPDKPTNLTMQNRTLNNPDYNMNIRGWLENSKERYLIDYGTPSIYNQPQLSTLFDTVTSITHTYQVNDWNWTANSVIGTAGTPLTNYPVTLISLSTSAGNIIRLPYTTNQPVNPTGEKAFVIFADSASQSITLKYTREDNVVHGYTIHLKGININPALLSLYNQLNSTGRIQMPAVNNCQVVGTAAGNEVLVAIRDEGTFMDPRSAEDWWGATTAPTIPVGGPIATQIPITTPLAGLSATPSVLKATPIITKQAANLPNCWNVQGPTTIRLGFSGNYKAQFSSPKGNVSGVFNAMKISNTTPTDETSWDFKPWPPTTLNAHSGTISLDWTPKSSGLYQIFCRSFNTTVNPAAECRGLTSTVKSSQSNCGPGSVMTINVTSATLPTPDIGQPDMCQFAVTIGGNTLTAQTPLSIAAIAKPNYDITNYTFAFYNIDNSDKPIIFTSGKKLFIDSTQNTIPLKFSDFDKADLNFKNAKPKNIKIEAFLTDTSGTVSTPSLSCTQYITVSNPAPSTQLTNSPTPDMHPGPINSGAIIAVMGSLIVILVVSFNFFFSA